MDKVSFVNKISTLMKATSDDANPIPGYLYQEVNKITFESEGYRESTLEFLVDRLNKQSCHVKFKVLKLLKYIVENGPSEFKLGLLKCSHGIREATKFSGPEDPFHGNIPNKAVRKIAEELSQLLFDTEVKGSPEKNEQKLEQDKSRITGLGNTNISPKGSLQGFGNSPTKTKSSFMDKLGQFTGVFQDRTKEQQMSILSSMDFCGDYRPPPCPVVGHKLPQQEVVEVKDHQVKPIQHIPGKVGGDWDDAEDSDVGYQATSLSSQDGDRTVEGIDNTAGDGEEETLLVTTLGGNDNMLLNIQEIREFLLSCQNVNCEKMVELLNRQLRSSSQPAIVKSLLLLEYMINTSLVNCDVICKTCQVNLLHLCQGETSMAQSKAKKILLTFEQLLDVKLFTTENKTDTGQLLLMED